ncbi:MAG: hypothetical protein H6546_08930 [Chitinophagales bacterium]|nr:hypothetical protein [Chitinophagales bacterium]
MNIQNKIDRIDEVLAQCEDILHGRAGEEVTEARKLLSELAITGGSADVRFCLPSVVDAGDRYDDSLGLIDNCQIMNMNPLDILRERHNLQHLSEKQLQAIVNTCAEIIVIQDQQFAEDETRKVIDMMGGCSVCGDLDGYSCICHDNDDDDDFQSCYGCDNPDACNDFGCAEKYGIKKPDIPGLF